MSDITEAAAPEATTETDVNDTSTPIEPTPEPTTLADKVTNQVEIPKKFLNEDGTPNYDKLAKSYVELEKFKGKAVPVTDPSEYEFAPRDESLFDLEAIGNLKEQVKDLGWSKEQFSKAMELYEDGITSIHELYELTPEKAETELSEAWGGNYKANINLAVKASKAFLPPDLDILTNNYTGNNPTVLRVLAEVGRQMQEDSAPSTNNTGKSSGLTKTEVIEMMQRPDYNSNLELQKLVSSYYQ